jgi:hypothetical protein
MGHEVGFHEARQRVVPIAERANRDGAPDGGPRAQPRPPSIKLLARHGEQAVDCRSTHREQLLPHAGFELQVAMSFESWEEHREQRLESLAADAISWRPRAR